MSRRIRQQLGGDHASPRWDRVCLVALVLSGPIPPSAPMLSSILRGDMWTLDPALPLCGIGGLDIASVRLVFPSR